MSDSQPTPTAEAQPAPAAAAPVPPPAAAIAEEAEPAKSRLRVPLMIGGVVIAIAIGLWMYLSGGRYADTDNAQLQTGLTMVSSNVSGRVVEVAVHENEAVRAGQVLFRIDPVTYQSGVDEAQAQLAGAVADAGATRADYTASQAEITRARTQLEFARREAARQGSLAAEGISSQAQLDQARLAVRMAQEAITAAQARAASVAAKMPGGSASAQPAAQRASAALRRARTALDDTVVRAAQDGIVTKVNELQVGSYVTAAKPLFVLAGRTYWIEANFKENQLRYMRLGQPATVKIDAFPDEELTGRVTSFSPGTGNAFSVLPAENATGNWVKVTQRLPVMIALDRVPAGLPLHAGLSADVSVDTGHERHLFGPDTPPKVPAKRSATKVAAHQ